MKKVFYCCVLVLILCSFWVVKINRAKAVDNLLALCMQPPTTVHSLTPGFMSESFKPTVNRITSGQVTMLKSGGGSASVTVGISTDGHSVVGGFPSATITVDRAEASIYQFELTANVDPNTTYYLYASSSDGSVGWSAVKDYPACYSDGQGLISGGYYGDIVSDYDFALYGLNVSNGPVITSLQANTITKTTANIYWATANVMSTSRVNYGTTAAYGSTKYSGYLVNSHLLTLDSLSSGTTYHYQVISSDGVNSTTSEDNTFVTESDTPSGGPTPSNPITPAATTSDVNASVPTVAAVSAASVQKTVDTGITVPTITSVTIGDKKTDAPIADQQSVTSGFVVIVNGKSFANAGIALMIGDKAFPGTADKDGAWQIAINSGDLVVGEYTVKAQAQDTKKNKGSAIVDLFGLKVIEKVSEVAIPESTTSEAKKDDSLWSKISGKYKWYTLALLVIILAGLVVGLYFSIRKRRDIKLQKTHDNSYQSRKLN